MLTYCHGLCLRAAVYVHPIPTAGERKSGAGDEQEWHFVAAAALTC